MNRDEYNCALCAAGYVPTLDEMVEVTFTVNARIRRIAAHTPNELPIWNYYTQVFWSSGVDLPDDLEATVLANELYLKLFGGEPVDWRIRIQFP